MDPAGVGSNPSGGSAGGKGQGTAGAGTGNASAGGAAAGGAPTGAAAAGGTGGTICSDAFLAPGVLPSPFVTREEVWKRLTPVIWGEAHAAPQELTEEATYAWAGKLVDDAFAQAAAEVGGVPGGTFFIRQWLGLEASSEALAGDYESQLALDDNILLEVLLQTSSAPGRTGVFSEKAWLARHPSISRRGVSMATLLFGLAIPPPPAGIEMGDLDSTLQDREALDVHSTNPSCRGCHAIFDPLGFSLGHFDRAGDYRELDHDRPIDTTGSFNVSSMGPIEFDGIAELGEKAANTCDATLAVVDGFLHVALDALGYDLPSRDSAVAANRERVQKAFIARGRSYHALVRAFAQSPLVLY